MGCLSPTPAYRQTLVISSGGSWLLGPMPSKLPPPYESGQFGSQYEVVEGQCRYLWQSFCSGAGFESLLGCENANPPGRLRIMP